MGDAMLIAFKRTDFAWLDGALRVLAVEDTRGRDEETGKPIPGSGDAHACDFCGRAHDILVTVGTCKGGDCRIIGQSCARALGIRGK